MPNKFQKFSLNSFTRFHNLHILRKEKREKYRPLVNKREFLAKGYMFSINPHHIIQFISPLQ